MFIRNHSNGIILDVYVQPGSRSSIITGLHGSRLKIKLAARAVEGAANEALCEFISELVQRPKSSITLISGQKARSKSIFIDGDADQLAKQFRQYLSNP
ncbi:MAG: DUF167 domain-containing protein [Candidatus Obscuribacterales bacterium]|nr:DUF167 domain-containing protein [Candidatus Obscuribacterales bacterium]